MRILILANTAWYLYNFRLNLMRALREAGYDVVSVSPADECVDKLREAGFTHRDWRLMGSSVNPVSEMLAVLGLCAILRREKADVVLAYTPKGNIYGTFAAKMASARIINNISGLGRAFIEEGLLASVAKQLYRIAFRWSSHTFFQNNEDMALFLKEGIADRAKVERLPGSGVDLKRFGISQEMTARESNEIVFLLIARMLWDKGIGEFVTAAKEIKKRYPKVRFLLLGFVGVDNPSAVSREQITSWVEEGVVEYLGTTNDVVPVIREADCVVLPSYREGVPRTLLEAASMAKPVIATDAPGCRDTVDDGLTGFLCRPKDSTDLTDKMLRMIHLSAEERAEMGHRGRLKMEREFDEQTVIDRYLEVLRIIEAQDSWATSVK